MSTIQETDTLTVTQVLGAPKESAWRNFISQFFRNKAAVVGAIIIAFYVFIAIFAPLLSPYDPYEIQLENKLQSPSIEHWMGTDDKGRDILSRILYGSRLSMGVGFAAVAFGAFFGILLE